MKNWSISSQLIYKEVEKLWFKVKKLVENKNLFTVTWNDKTYIFKNIECWLNTILWARLVNDKELTYTILSNDMDDVVPNSIYLSKDKNYDISNIWINYPLVVKPVDQAHGDWVSVNITNAEELQTSIDFAFSFSDKIIIQNFVQGYDHRILVVGDNISAVAKRIPTFVIWDWKSTIEELINKENKNPLRGKQDHDFPMSLIKIDDELKRTISSKWETLSSILKK